MSRHIELPHQTNHSGVVHWKWQRYSAIVLIPLTFWLLFSLIYALRLDFTQARIWVAQSHVVFLLSIWLLTAIFHAALGLEVVLEDYIANINSRIAFIRIAKTLLIITLLLGLASIARIALL